MLKANIFTRKSLNKIVFCGSRISNFPEISGFFTNKEFCTFPKIQKSIPVKTPELAESIVEGTLSQWNKKVGDIVEKDEEIASIETDKIDSAVIAPEKGIIKEILVSDGENVSINQELAIIDTDVPAEDARKEDKEDTAKISNTKALENNKAKHSSEQVKQAHQSKEQSPELVKQAHQSKERSSEQVKQAHQSKEHSSEQVKHAHQSKDQAEIRPRNFRHEERVKMSRMRLRTAERLKESQNRAASLTTFNEVDMSSVMEMRSLYNKDTIEKHGIKMGFISVFAKAVCQAIKEIPAINAAIEGPDPGNTLVYRDYVDISMAVATPKGLVTPVVSNAERKSFLEIEKDIARLSKMARDGKLTMEDLVGGTFTISNGGVFGSLMGTPIINLPQTAVLGLHAVKEKPVVINGKIEIRPMMYLALTYDHRVVDGREAVTFLKRVKGFVEDPRRLLIS